MNTHKNARLTPHGRALLVHRVLVEGLRPEEVAQAQGVSVRTVYKWVRRFRKEGHAGLQNRSSRPGRSPFATDPATVEQIIECRQRRQTYRQIAEALGIGRSTVARILRREGLNRLAALEPARPDNRYEHEAPGDLLHLDIKKLGRFARPGHRITGDRQQNTRGAGWEYAHIAIDDHSRVAFATLYPNETGWSACYALLDAVRYYRGLGVHFIRVLTDNGACYKSKPFRRLCRRLGLKHKRTRPYTPRTNGKAERFIQTALREWAYARSYESSAQRGQHLPAWLHQYNWHRPHASLDYHPPVSRLGLSVNNLVGLHT
ncbi:IS481 family transposase [Halomonas sp. 3H]|jgi:transposase InsO family protein|uniref:IS481 family transposase n=1 Tax=Candidatus Viridilinea halotolerans TaxID=2491704 RepID=A0A426U1E0_9CHLR|nr:IS481 family transposase [Halomonas sp. 3H]RRR73208.1 MAG: IS481 family transposase [Candidatus Viridilinea halotolerans]